PPLSFPDVPSSYWAYSEIMKLVEEGVINGYPDGTFKPEFPVTRAEFAKMVLLSLGYSKESPPTPSFPDLDPTEWYYGYVEGAVKHGLVKGYPDGTFKPQGNITIAEILTVIVRAKGWSETSPPGPPPYIYLRDRDDSLRLINPLDWYYGVVGASTQNGLLLFPDYSQITLPGAGSGEYEVRFNSPATRAQTAVFLSRLIGD
ncbi:MAG: S-layer homology domain-containing protein, partial [Caldisericota bacterium]|nr:S-layer homology domain-containing protein [Caldisericota bacterium]